MTKYKSLIFRELKLSRKSYLIGLALIGVFTLFMLLSMFVLMSQTPEGESIDIFSLGLSYGIAAVVAAVAMGDSSALKSDVESGWSTYSFALPVTAFDKAVVSIAVKVILLIVGAIIVLPITFALHAIGASTFSPAVMYCYFIVADVTLIFHIVYHTIVIRADDTKTLKKLGTIAGIVIVAVFLLFDFIFAGSSDAELEAFMLEMENSSSPSILNKYIGYITISDTVGIIGIVSTFVILAVGFVVMMKNHERRRA